jgi:predicted amidohydrolase
VSATRRVVAVQLAARVGAVEANLRHIEDVVGQAVREHGPDMVLLPEVAAAPNVCHPVMRTCARPVAGAPFQLARRLAREHGCVVGLGALTIRGRDTRNTYFLAEPDGTVHLHDKDQPSIWESNYYAAGRDEGIFDTAAGAIGCANGFEWTRTRTAERLRGRVRLLAGGMCFPSYPSWRLTGPYFWRREHETMLQFARETPGRMARALGVPAVHPSHVGDVTMRTPMAGPIPWPTILVGETQITDADGAILARLAYEDGEGYVAADVAWDEPRPRDPVPPGFWMATVPVSLHVVWHAGNAHGAAKYRAMKALRRHPWQHAPGYGEDLPDRVAPEMAPPAAAATGAA